MIPIETSPGVDVLESKSCSSPVKLNFIMTHKIDLMMFSAVARFIISPSVVTEYEAVYPSTHHLFCSPYRRINRLVLGNHATDVDKSDGEHGLEGLKLVTKNLELRRRGSFTYLRPRANDHTLK